MPLVSRASSASTTIPDDKIEVWSDALYHRIREEPQGTWLSQEDLMRVGIVSDVKHLMLVINKLYSGFFLRARKDAANQMQWTWRKEEEAKKFSLIPNREYLSMYDIIESAGNQGIWARSIRWRGNMTENMVKQGLKWLENKGLISEFKSVEQPNKKMYILSSLRPSERATGGPWYTNGELDEGLVNGMQKIVYKCIKDRSTYFSKGGSSSGGMASDQGAPSEKKGRKQPTKGTMRGSPRGIKRTAAEANINSEKSIQKMTIPRFGGPRQGPQIMGMETGYTAYPTALEITQFISNAKVTEDPLTQSDIQDITNMLEWEGQIEPIRLAKGRIGYEVTVPDRIPATTNPEDENDEVLGIAQEPQISHSAEMPCGTCLVSEQCEPGSKVSPEKCKYYADWLDVI
ncbi:putative DNA-directed RNA polymerase III subunit rpc6 [Zalerion maritima]|uniref:DNA-directed RNA polymerase III subunit RPC6 n=1 Tax=Zalerion maritima TaxID=339359 RepID=A0AAD5WSA6_9PEZI|nr:putative DNA-directed RNA polymerase III subunit rpc6 [Zalerion maritima]